MHRLMVSKMTTRKRREVAIRGDIVARLREAKGYTQGELAYHSGVDQSQISKIEAGIHTDVYLSTAIRLAEALGVRVDDLTKRGTLEPVPPPTPEDEAELATYQQLDRDSYISPDVREVLKRIVAEEHKKWKERQRQRLEE